MLTVLRKLSLGSMFTSTLYVRDLQHETKKSGEKESTEREATEYQTPKNQQIPIGSI